MVTDRADLPALLGRFVPTQSGVDGERIDVTTFMYTHKEYVNPIPETSLWQRIRAWWAR